MEELMQMNSAKSTSWEERHVPLKDSLWEEYWAVLIASTTPLAVRCAEITELMERKCAMVAISTVKHVSLFQVDLLLDLWHAMRDVTAL
jgi:hypothetical protein